MCIYIIGIGLCPFNAGYGVSGYPPGPVDACSQCGEGSPLADLPPSVM